MAAMSVGECARKIGARPRDISNLLYFRDIDDAHCPLIGNRRIIEPKALPAIKAALERRGLPVNTTN